MGFTQIQLKIQFVFEQLSRNYEGSSWKYWRAARQYTTTSYITSSLQCLWIFPGNSSTKSNSASLLSPNTRPPPPQARPVLLGFLMNSFFEPTTQINKKKYIQRFLWQRTFEAVSAQQYRAYLHFSIFLKSCAIRFLLSSHMMKLLLHLDLISLHNHLNRMNTTHFRLFIKVGIKALKTCQSSGTEQRGYQHYLWIGSSTMIQQTLLLDFMENRVKRFLTWTS